MGVAVGVGDGNTNLDGSGIVDITGLMDNIGPRDGCTVTVTVGVTTADADGMAGAGVGELLDCEDDDPSAVGDTWLVGNALSVGVPGTTVAFASTDACGSVLDEGVVEDAAVGCPEASDVGFGVVVALWLLSTT